MYISNSTPQLDTDPDSIRPKKLNALTEKEN